MALPGENIAKTVSSVKLAEGPTLPAMATQTLIKSSQLVLQLEQSLIPDDPRFAKLQLEGSLPILDLDFSEYRLMELVKLVVTLPFPVPDVPDSAAPSPVLSTV